MFLVTCVEYIAKIIPQYTDCIQGNYPSSALCFLSGIAQFQTCYDNATSNCTGNVVTGVSKTRKSGSGAQSPRGKEGGGQRETVV